MKKRIFLAFILTWFGLSAEQIPQSNENKEESTKLETKDSSQKPRKYETGTLTVDAQAVSNNLKNQNLKALKKLKSSFHNFQKEEEFKKLSKSYMEGVILLQEKKYVESRRVLEVNNENINQAAKGLLDNYSKEYSKLFQETSSMVIEIKINSESPNAGSFSEKLIATAVEHQTIANQLMDKNNNTEAINRYKLALGNLIKVHYLNAKTSAKGYKLSDKLSKNLLIEDDFVPKNYLLLYDDSKDQIFNEKEKDRLKERENIKKTISAKFGDISPTDKGQEDKVQKNDSAKSNSTDSKVEPKK